MGQRTERESERLEEVSRYGGFAEAEEAALDGVARLAAEYFSMPMAAVSLIGDDQLYLHGIFGFTARAAPRDASFCAVLLGSSNPHLIVHDAARETDFATLRLVTDETGARFYAGARIVTANGHTLGTLCVLDCKPREFGAAEAKALHGFAAHALQVLELRRRTADSRMSGFAVKARDFRPLATEAPVGILETDAAGSCRFVNRRWCELTGTRPGDALGRGWESAIHAEDRERFLPSWKQAAAHGAELNDHFRFVAQDGRTTWVSVHACAMRDAAERPCGYVGVLVDISEWKELAESLAAENQEIQAARLAERQMATRLTLLVDELMRTQVPSSARAAFEPST